MDLKGKDRIDTRRNLMIYLDCIDKGAESNVGKIVDITPEGMMLISEEPLETKTKAEYEIVLPALEEFANLKLEVTGICRWSRKDEVGDIYYMGIAFLEKQKNADEIINKLIDKLGFSNGQKKIFTTAGDIEFR